eukprot:TRINITY_DN12427_c0_g1_i1.p1 TRINITY_DN12427_c0_g1~~TRINITY_DN12427_c0_g1_i1.p1  ORF type:complete len:185 (+),score=2.75 TRINITY_DN12427_c0_g1_i1:1-555(+)
MFVYLSLFASRLLDVSVEERSATKIQRAWRRSQIRNYYGYCGTTLSRWKQGALVISRAVRKWLVRKKLQESLGKLKQCTKGIVRVQAVWRGRCQAFQYQMYRAKIIKCQSIVRGYLARKYLHSLRQQQQQQFILQQRQTQDRAALVIQQNYRWNSQIDQRTAPELKHLSTESTESNRDLLSSGE